MIENNSQRPQRSGKEIALTEAVGYYQHEGGAADSLYRKKWLFSGRPFRTDLYAWYGRPTIYSIWKKIIS
jgi:hypothetical protein